MKKIIYITMLVGSTFLIDQSLIAAEKNEAIFDEYSKESCPWKKQQRSNVLENIFESKMPVENCKAFQQIKPAYSYSYFGWVKDKMSVLTERLLKKVLPLRLHIPLVSSKSLIIICDPSEIDEVVTSSSMHHGILSDPILPSWLNWISQVNFTFIPNQTKKQAFVNFVDPSDDEKYYLNRPERIALHKSMQMMPKEGISSLAAYMTNDIDKQKAQYQLACVMLQEFTKTAPPKDLTIIGEAMGSRMKSPWDYNRSEEARKKLIEWSSLAGKQCTNIPDDVDHAVYKKNIMSDIYHILAECTFRSTWQSIEEVKNRLHKPYYEAMTPEALVDSVLLSNIPTPRLFRVAKESCSLHTLPYQIKKGDTFVLMMSVARKTANNLHYTFLECCGQKYVRDFLERAIIETKNQHFVSKIDAKKTN